MAQVADWLAAMGPPNGRKFFILGRTDDLALNATKAENDTYNAGLAQARANAAQNLLDDSRRPLQRHRHAAFGLSDMSAVSALGSRSIGPFADQRSRIGAGTKHVR